MFSSPKCILVVIGDAHARILYMTGSTVFTPRDSQLEFTVGNPSLHCFPVTRQIGNQPLMSGFRNFIGHSRILTNQASSFCFDRLSTHGLRLAPSTLYPDPVNCHHPTPFGCRNLHLSLRLKRARKMSDQSRNVWILKGKQMGVALTHGHIPCDPHSLTLMSVTGSFQAL